MSRNTGQEPASPRLSQLPEELVSKILAATACGEACGVRDRCQLSTVCRQWSCILSSTIFWQEMLFITNTFADAEVLSRAIIGSACRAEAAEAAWRIRIAEVAGQTVACRFVYGLSTRLQRHSGANVGFAADKKELELWLAEVVRRLKYQPGIAEHDRDILAEVLTGKHFRMPTPPHSSGSWLLAGGALKDMSLLAGSLFLYMSVGVWAHLLLSFICAPVIGCFYLLTRV